MSRKVAVIGGGAAGMMAAIQAAGAGADVAVYERNDRVGKKILSTGNGKCNFSNTSMGEGVYFGSASELAADVLRRFDTAWTKAFFEGLGMRVREKEGYLYPATEQASTVLDVLRFALGRLGVDLHTGCFVEEIHKVQGGYRIVCGTEPATAEGQRAKGRASAARQEYDAVIIACGGMAAPKTGSDGSGFALAKKLGHHIVHPLPALCALRCKGGFWKSIAGVRCTARVTLLVDAKECRSEKGELQLTDYGVSGIPVFQISRDAAYALYEKKNTAVILDFLPEYDDNEYSLFWEQRWERHAGQTMEEMMTGVVNKKIALFLLKKAEIGAAETAGNVSFERRKALERLCRCFRAEVERTNSFEQAQVCAGGVSGAELSADLESLKAPGVFFAGEIIDVDGICGGYNLQWAWSSGAAAGIAAAGCME